MMKLDLFELDELKNYSLNLKLSNVRSLSVYLGLRQCYFGLNGIAVARNSLSLYAFTVLCCES